MRNERFDFLYLPQQFHTQHKLCEFLLYQIEDFILKDTYSGLKNREIKFDGKIELMEGEHILDYMLKIGKSEEHNQIISNHILNALIADTCQFLQIALFSSMQKRLTVSFSLLRKPFVYNLLVFLRLTLTTDFLERFNTEEKFDTTALSQNEILELLNYSERILLSKSIKGSDIYDFVFNPYLHDSLVNLSNRALHPSTTRVKANETGIKNINFVFSTKKNIMEQWLYLYSRLPLLLLYLNEFLEAIIFHRLKLDKKVFSERLIERNDFFKKIKLRK